MTLKKINFQQYYSEIISKNSYLSHGIHSYTAKLIPQIPRYFIENYSNEGDLILDPFCGSGTTLLEAKILCRNAVGLDINPLAALISEVKSTQLDENELTLAIQDIKNGLKQNKIGTSVDIPNIDYWFSSKAQKELLSIKFNVESLKNKYSDEIYKFLLVTFSSIIRKSSFADPRMAKTYKSKRVITKINEGWEPASIQYFVEALDRNFKMMKTLSEYINSNNYYVRTFAGDARNTAKFLKKMDIKTNLIITSPPYINAQDYFRSYKFELWWLGLATPDEVTKLRKTSIGTENTSGYDRSVIPTSEDEKLQTILNKIWKKDKFKAYIIHNYFNDMNSTLTKFYKSLENTGHLCLITGNNTICEMLIPTNKILNRMAKNMGFEQVEIVKDEIKNRALAPNRNHNGGMIKEEWISVFEKE